MRARLAVIAALMASACATERVADPPLADSCGAWKLQHLVGRPISEIPSPARPDLQRVACTTCPVTQDFNPARVNFFFDSQTKLIAEVRCG